ncbi:MAG TPA: alpha-hydroxy acid oxidase [Acidimicrobiales bacterium]|jgi:isopentenyl diphosphate isomerase/L-lactate dehydrogenase-like FMN-dependent dehydrogenase|nr:alpha-hydroxy acid oxidase [Acidimicrobiales bacterium]
MPNSLDREVVFQSYEDILKAARRRLPKSIFTEIASGRDRGVTLKANVEAFDKVFLVPRAAVATVDREKATTVLGREIAMPVIIDPVGALRLLHPDGAIAAARAAHDAGTICAVSMVAGHSIQELRAATTGPLWQQLYLFNGREYAEEVISQAKSCGYDALVVTVDYPVASKSPSALGINLRSALQYAPELIVRPRWTWGFVRDGMRVGLANAPNPRSSDIVTAQWDDFAWIREKWGGPVIVKGIITPEDARRAVDAGASAIVVSNHGGIVLDGTPATLSSLPAIKRAVGDSVEVLLDGGVRQGSDVVKALALGAKAVLIGRPYVLALGAAGQQGVRAVLEYFSTQLDRCLGMVGCQNVADLDDTYVTSPWSA